MANRESDLREYRDRVRALDGILAAHAILLETQSRQIDKLDGQVGRMLRADDIAEAVARKVRDDRVVHLTRWQEIIAGVAVLAAIASPFVQFLH